MLLAPTTPETLEAVQTASKTTQVVEADYYSYGRDTWSRRRIEPYQVFNTEGQWYVQARAQEVNEVRNFRVDRMRNAPLLEETFLAPEHRPEARVYQARDTDPIVTLDLQKPRDVGSGSVSGGDERDACERYYAHNHASQ